MNQKWHKSWALGAVFLAALVAGGGGTLALWTGQDEAPAAAITAGDLDVEAGVISWTETSPDVAAAPHLIDADTFVARQGDTFEVNYAFQTRLQGENMLAGLSMGWPEAGNPGVLSLPAGVTGSYRVVALQSDTSSVDIVPVTPLGEAPVLDLAAMTANSIGREDTFGLVVTLDFAGLSDRFGADSARQVTDLGAFTITLDQLRVGEGYE